MKKIYICGQVTGLPRDEAFKLFADRERLIRKAGYIPVNPMRIIRMGTEWRQAMKICIHHLMDCDGITILHNWRESRGARMEVQVAELFELQTIEVYASQD